MINTRGIIVLMCCAFAAFYFTQHVRPLTSFVQVASWQR